MTDQLDRLKAALADRYAIEKELGAGGMATVYLAEDLKHKRRVAVKVLRPELAAVLGAERFVQEITTTANLQHPHILPLFDSGQADSFLYYVMPYIEGETLRDKLNRETQLGIDEAVKISTEVADALDYAHRNNVIHRDIKPENILFESGHAVVADFGIARAVSGAGGDELTASGMAIGTPTYMSPEQASGDALLDVRSDIYSLGCVLYEMLSGDPPFTGSTAQAILARKATDPVPSLKTVRETVPESVEAAVRKALARVAADRHATARDFATALSPAYWRARRKGRPIIIAAIAITALAVGALVWRTLGTSGPTLTRSRVLVTAFQNETGDSDFDALSSITADWLTRSLQETGLMQVVDVRVVSPALSKPEQDENLGSVTALAVARGLGAGTVVSGAYYRQRDSVLFQAHITETATGVTLHSLGPVAGPIAEPLETVELLRQHVVGAMASILDQSWPVAFPKPPTYEAYREYVTAIPMIGRQDYGAAIERFLRAAGLDSSFTLPRIYAATIMTGLSMFGSADSLLRTVERVRDQLPALEVHLLEYARARLRGDWAEALAEMRPVAYAAPLSEANWEVGRLLVRLNRPREAIEFLSQLDPAREQLKNWSFYWTVKGIAHHVLGEHDLELQTARDGRAGFPQDPDLVAAELSALAALGRIEELTRRLDELTENAPAAPPSVRPPMWYLTEAAKELRAHGHVEAAKDVLRQVQQWGRELSDTSVAHRTHLALVAYFAEQWEDAQLRLHELADVFPENVDYQGYLGTIAARRGDRELARRISDWLDDVEAPYLYGTPALWQARIAALLGETEEAIAKLRAALQDGLPHYGTGPFKWTSGVDVAWLHRDVDLGVLRDVPAFQELARPKG